MFFYDSTSKQQSNHLLGISKVLDVSVKAQSIAEVFVKGVILQTFNWTKNIVKMNSAFEAI